MKLKLLTIFSIFGLICVGSANANWQYPIDYPGAAFYKDDGSRFTLSVRGGAAIGFGSVKNKMGYMTSEYYVDVNTGDVISAADYDGCPAGVCDNYEYAGEAVLSNLSVPEKFSGFGFIGGASLGFTLPHTPQWRVEFGWDHITKTEYNVSPLFEGDIALEGGAVPGVIIHEQIGAVQSDIVSDIISVMAFYDFYDGVQKPLHKMIPYVGFGIGYADSKTTLQLSDIFGNLSNSGDLPNYGEEDENGILQFSKSEKNNTNVAGLLALGFSYGINPGTYLDAGVRLAYIPKVTWELSNEAGTRTREWYTINGLIYTNVMVGVRFEF